MKGKPVRFIGIDGEAINDKYVMLCASDGSYVQDMEGLDTYVCLEFILSLKRKYPNRKIVGFAWTYDTNLILRGKDGLSLAFAKQIWDHKELTLCTKEGLIYELTWVPSKFLAIHADVKAEVQDVFGFFQTKFITALEQWKIPDMDGAFDRIKEGKLNRGNFAPEEVDKIRAYCITECEMLVELAEALQDSLRGAGLHISKWIGAGSVGQALIQKYDVLEHHVADSTYSKELLDAVMYGYFGGRFEMFRQGYFPTCSNYDIISAYPYECLSLPTLYGSWERSRKYVAKADYAIWLCSWDLASVAEQRKVMPFPYRLKGKITYPSTGKGWYWAKEVRAALRLHPEIQVLGGYVFTPASDVKPFAFLTDIWEKRKEAKANKHPSEKAYKLGMNSLYGKLAQGKGFQGSVPRQRSFVWAGMITSNTRARLLGLMDGQPDNVIAVATDGVFFESDPVYPIGDNLGELEVNNIAEYYQISNGIYYSPNAKMRTRGHHPGELDWDLITAIWEEEKFGGTYNYKARRFIGLGQALMRRDFSLWCQWLESERKIHMSQWIRKYPSAEDIDSFTQTTLEADNYSWYAPMADGIKLGDKYQPKTDIFSTQTPAQREAVLKYIELLDQPDIQIEG